MKHIWISGIKLPLIEERHPVFRNLKWMGHISSSYSIHVFPKKDDTGGIIACSDAFGGEVGWARYEGKNPMIGKEQESLDPSETAFLKRKYPAFYEAITNLDA